MKKLFLLMLLCPVMLPAQIAISEFKAAPGAVTFTVSWNKTPRDSAWVFVDYNKSGTMTRLPLSDVTASAGRAYMVPGNDQGAWVMASNAGAFSATVQLLTATATADFPGACVYAIDYPPVGNMGGDKITFTGTPPFYLQLGDGTSLTVSSTYTLPASNTLMSFTDASGAPGTIIITCTPPGSTVDFTVFDPCSDATTGDFWYLTDSREANTDPPNPQTYKVKKMVDGHIWMVQDLRFGNKCTNKTSFTGSGKDLINNITSLTDKTYYGDCMNAKNSSTPSDRGFLYDWAAAINKSGAYYGSSLDVGCSGTLSGTLSPNPGACQGICPIDWHIPTGCSNGEFLRLQNMIPQAGSSPSAFWFSHTGFEGVYGGWFNFQGLCDQGSSVFYRSSTACNAYFTCGIEGNTRALQSLDTCYNNEKHEAFQVRCVMNY
jgi:uncharacterized protein (TIGR02145 family)